MESMGVKNKPARTTGASGWLNRPKIRRSIKIALFLAPILVFAVLFVYYPFVKTIINSFSIVNQRETSRALQGWITINTYSGATISKSPY